MKPKLLRIKAIFLFIIALLGLTIVILAPVDSSIKVAAFVIILSTGITIGIIYYISRKDDRNGS